MRPPILDVLFAPVSTLAGIGPKLEKNLTKLFHGQQPGAVARLSDLIFHLPNSVIDRRNQPEISGAADGEIVTLKVWIDKHEPPPRGNRRAPYKVTVHDETSYMSLVFFHAHQQWIEKALPVGEMRYISGTMERYNDRPSMVHPDHMVDEDEFAKLPLVDPVYGTTAGVSTKVLGKAVRTAVENVPDLPEWIDPPLIKQQKWPSLREALDRVHYPRDALDLTPDCVARRRLAMDELLSGQLALALTRAKIKKTRGLSRPATGKLSSRLLATLPYDLTGAQKRSVEEINADLAHPERMLRLLQGDVGAGKTVVALMAAMTAIENGGQAAIMAPTEILARQHLATIKPLCDQIGLKVDLLSGREKGAQRKEIYAGLANGEINLIVGTHALFQEAVVFDDLALAVVDEQHRFGVHQRLTLGEKGRSVDMLVMTATPIPRTLVLTYFGDMDVSKLDEKPAGRQPIKTTAMALDRLDDLVARVGSAIENGQKLYWICPLVEESEELPLISATDRHLSLVSVFGDRVGLVHGRMAAAEKDTAMAAFKDGETKILVATTVVEVGVDVPDATIMVIEHAERFGLSQLHQLRGRVGRGAKASSCILLYKSPLGEVAKARLNIMRESEDGFRIAEEDLKLRGEGEVLGTRQSGSPGFSLANLEYHGDVLEMARDQARMIVSQDPDLEGSNADAIRAMLYLFGQDQAIKLLRAG